MSINGLWREEEDNVQSLLRAQGALATRVGTDGVAEELIQLAKNVGV